MQATLIRVEVFHCSQAGKAGPPLQAVATLGAACRRSEAEQGALRLLAAVEARAARQRIPCFRDATLPLPRAGLRLLLANNLHNNEQLMPHYITQMLRLLALLPPGSAFVSVYESGSKDRTGGRPAAGQGCCARACTGPIASVHLPGPAACYCARRCSRDRTRGRQAVCRRDVFVSHVILCWAPRSTAHCVWTLHKYWCLQQHSRLCKASETHTGLRLTRAVWGQARGWCCLIRFWTTSKYRIAYK